MVYLLSPADVTSITDAECAFGTTRLLPALEDIPNEFKSQRGNIYTKIADCIFFGREMPDAELKMKDGFDPEAVNRCVRAHLTSWSPKHQHKISGVGFMISITMDIVEKVEEAKD